MQGSAFECQGSRSIAGHRVFLLPTGDRTTRFGSGDFPPRGRYAVDPDTFFRGGMSWQWSVASSNHFPRVSLPMDWLESISRSWKAGVKILWVTGLGDKVMQAEHRRQAGGFAMADDFMEFRENGLFRSARSNRPRNPTLPGGSHRTVFGWCPSGKPANRGWGWPEPGRFPAIHSDFLVHNPSGGK